MISFCLPALFAQMLLTNMNNVLLLFRKLGLFYFFYFIATKQMTRGGAHLRSLSRRRSRSSMMVSLIPLLWGREMRGLFALPMTKMFPRRVAKE